VSTERGLAFLSLRRWRGARFEEKKRHVPMRRESNVVGRGRQPMVKMREFPVKGFKLQVGYTP
jgi:hypothetical protein